MNLYPLSTGVAVSIETDDQVSPVPVGADAVHVAVDHEPEDHAVPDGQAAPDDHAVPFHEVPLLKG